jgi:hypothetical protein
MMTSHRVFAIFLARECPACGGRKSPNTALCVTCYRALPKEKRAELWNRFGAGFEEAFEQALRFLSETFAHNVRAGGRGAAANASPGGRGESGPSTEPAGAGSEKRGHAAFGHTTHIAQDGPSAAPPTVIGAHAGQGDSGG